MNQSNANPKAEKELKTKNMAIIESFEMEAKVIDGAVLDGEHRGKAATIIDTGRALQKNKGKTEKKEQDVEASK